MAVNFPVAEETWNSGLDIFVGTSNPMGSFVIGSHFPLQPECARSNSSPSWMGMKSSLPVTNCISALCPLCWGTCYNLSVVQAVAIFVTKTHYSWYLSCNALDQSEERCSTASPKRKGAYFVFWCGDHKIFIGYNHFCSTSLNSMRIWTQTSSRKAKIAKVQDYQEFMRSASICSVLSCIFTLPRHLVSAKSRFFPDVPFTLDAFACPKQWCRSAVCGCTFGACCCAAPWRGKTRQTAGLHILSLLKRLPECL